MASSFFDWSFGNPSLTCVQFGQSKYYTQEEFSTDSWQLHFFGARLDGQYFSLQWDDNNDNDNNNNNNIMARITAHWRVLRWW